MGAFLGKYRLKAISFVLLALIMFSATYSFAESAEEPVQGFRSTELPLPRFVSLRSDKVYVRTGPALRYPIKWIYKRDSMPVEIVQEFENWRKVKGFDGEQGWIHQSLLSGERSVIITGASELIPMREGFNDKARLVAQLEPQVIASLDKCSGDWCRVETGGYRGWVARNFLWGIYEDEELN